MFISVNMAVIHTNTFTFCKLKELHGYKRERWGGARKRGARKRRGRSSCPRSTGSAQGLRGRDVSVQHRAVFGGKTLGPPPLRVPLLEPDLEETGKRRKVRDQVTRQVTRQVTGQLTRAETTTTTRVLEHKLLRLRQERDEVTGPGDSTQSWHEYSWEGGVLLLSRRIWTKDGSVVLLFSSSGLVAPLTQ